MSDMRESRRKIRLSRVRQVLVTGGAGFIGSHLTDRLVGEGFAVSVVDDLSGGRREYVNPKAKFFHCDLREAGKAARIIEKIRPELVYHLAANAAEMKAQFSPIDITSRNYNTFINTLVPALRGGMRRFVFTSSIAVYGSGQAPFRETDRPEPKDLYGISKLAIEESLKVLAEVHNFEYVIARPHNVYGPRQNMSDPYRNVVMIFMNALLKKQPYTIYGGGRQRRCFSYVDDVVDALFGCGFFDVSEMTFNIGSDEAHSINELSDLIQKISGVRLPHRSLGKRPQEVQVAIANHSLSRRYLGYQDRVSLREGIALTWRYAKQRGYQEPIFTSLELPSPKLPKNWRVRQIVDDV